MRGFSAINTTIATLGERLHTGGEPLRVFTSGLPPIRGQTVLEKRRYFREHYDYIRTRTMWEPRGHADMYGAVVTRAKDADFDVFFLHNEGYSSMCGHAIIALTTLAIETGLVRGRTGNVELTINVPAGTVHARAVLKGGKVRLVSFRNVPSFLYLRDAHVDVEGLGRIGFDVAYGGAFYAFVDAEQLQLELTPECVNRHIDLGRRIKRAVADRFPIKHPFEEELSFLYGTIFTGPPCKYGNYGRNVCVFANGEIDRSATGTGVSAWAALHHAKGETKLNQELTIESIIGTTMTVLIVGETKFGPYDAVIPEVSGTAFITGRNELLFDTADPLCNGFLLR